jgi:deoxyxylulose-5-phosphate synthase
VLELAAAKTAGGEKQNAIRVLGAPRKFIKHDTRPTQLSQVGINADTIAQTVKEMLQT